MVDEPASVAFADLDDSGRRICCCHELGNDLGRRGCSLGLEYLQPLEQFGLCRFGLGSHGFPDSAVVLGLSDLDLNLIKRLSRIFLCGAILAQLGAKCIELGFQFCTLVCRGRWRLERA